MINMMVANARDKGVRARLEKMLNAQVHNSLELGWPADSVIVVSNFAYSFMGVRAMMAPLNESCLTGSKMFALEWLMPLLQVREPIWAHDLDAWQNSVFSFPEFRDVGIAQYSNSKYNGGSVFWGGDSLDIVNEICRAIRADNLMREEPTLNKVLKSDAYKGRVTVVNNTFNVGCSGYVVRVRRSDKPLRVCHFHPDNRIAWETHALDRNEIGEVGITVRLERLIRHYYPNLATKVVTKKKPLTDGREQK